MRRLAVFAAAVMALALVGCSNNGAPKGDESMSGVVKTDGKDAQPKDQYQGPPPTVTPPGRPKGGGN